MKAQETFLKLKEAYVVNYNEEVVKQLKELPRGRNHRLLCECKICLQARGVGELGLTRRYSFACDERLLARIKMAGAKRVRETLNRYL